jgi:DNA-binding response OmpR family regulator
MERVKVLLVEDDETASELIVKYLTGCGFDITPVFTATDGISHIRHDDFDIVLLDMNLPDFNGFEVLKSIQARLPVPVIVTSAYSDTRSKLTAFKYGADDYMVKPLDMEELEARIWVQLKRNSKIRIEEDEKLFEVRNGNMYFKGKYLELTTIEFEIFVCLLKNRNQIVSREELLGSLSAYSSQRSLDNHIKNIRKKIGDSGSRAQYLKTVYGIGYTLNI